ncbi:hypothetical protein GCM10028794_25990 [Silanimonas algicola]
MRSTALPPLLLSVLLVAAGAVAAAAPVRVGILSSGPTLDRRADWGPWARAIEAGLGEGAEVHLVMLPPAALRAAVLRGELDVVITNPVHFIEIRAERPFSGAVATIDMDPSEPATPYFGGVIVRRQDRPEWAALNGLSGARVAYQDRGLLGGYAAPMRRIIDAGVRPTSLRLERTGPAYDDVLDAVLEERADIGFVRTGLLEQWRRIGDARVGQLEVVAPMDVPGFPYVTSTPVYPEWPVVLLPQFDEQRARRFAQVLLAMEPGSAALVAAGIGQVAVPADYSGVEALLRELRLPPFDSPVRVAWYDVWTAHRGTMVGVFALFLAALWAVVGLTRSRRRHRRDALALAAAKQAVDEERRRLRGILGAVRAGTWEWNVQTGELRVNRHWAEMIGYRLEELAPIDIETFRSRVHPDDVERVWDAVQAHLRGETRRYDVDLRMRHRLGHWVSMRDRGEVVARDVEGRPLWMSGLHLDTGRSEAGAVAELDA